MIAGAVAREETLAEAAWSVAKEFLQSVVVVDDQAAYGPEDSGEVHSATEPAGGAASGDAPSAAESSGEPHSRGRRPLPKLVSPSQAAGERATPEQALDAKILIDGFADHGLVCAIIRPTAVDASADRAVKAARRSDIVVLDWELNKDSGTTTLEIIRRLVHDEADTTVRGRLRLIAVYSGALDLHSIASKVRHSLEAPQTGHSFREDGNFAIVAGLVRIVVFSKPTTRLGATGNELEELKKRVVSGTELPDRLIQEFAELTTGLVPHVALASLAALRKNTHRVLARLRSDLDPAYLWHRVTQARPADAEDHLVELVVSELRSVLEDQRVGKWANIDAIRQWLTKDGRPNYAEAFGETTPRTRNDVELLLTNGSAGKSADDQNVEIRKKFGKICTEKEPQKKEIAGFASDATAALRANEHLAALMSLKTRYENTIPRLELGIILSSGNSESLKYWLCVQPRCDSVRLTGSVAFPLLPLEPALEKKFDLLVPKESGGYSRFRVSKKPAHLVVPIFVVNPTDGDSVLAVRDGESYIFKAIDGQEYKWVAELKADLAQRIAQQLANEFSRVGMSESEWLRLSGR